MNLSVKQKLFFAMFFIAFTSSIAFGIYIYTSQKSLFYQSMEEKLLSATEAGGLYLGNDYVDKYTNDTPISEENHLTNLKKLSEYAKSVGMEYIYLMIQDQGKIYTVLSSATDEEIEKKEYDEFMTHYEEPSDNMINGFSENNSFYEDAIDEYGHFYSYLTVKKSPKGRLYMLGSDIEISYINKELNNILIQTIIIIAIIMIIVTIVAIFVANFIAKRISQVESNILDFFSFLNGEANKTNHIIIDSNDEFGKMNRLINTNIDKIESSLRADKQMVENTLNISKMVKDGNLNVSIDSTPQNPQLIELKNVLNDMFASLYKSIDTVAIQLEKYIDNDYSTSIENSKSGEVKILIDGINNLRDEIVSMLSISLENGLTLQKSSNILNQNVEQLAQSSIEAAKSLENTTVAIQQITANIRQNNSDVNTMTKYAESVTKSVSDGQSLANRTTLAMDDINEQVSSINDAITVIDQIAFQTNILSLNAAVEAATAGEAGKGFAVVAGEVRNLAGRSSEAAKEIATLVESAKAKADDGKNIANDMINGYDNLNSNISKTIELIDEVEKSSTEQLSGIEQINSSITEVDRQSQENAKIAHSTKDISQSNDEIANLIVNNVNSKTFPNKDNIKAKEIVS
jgi:methyl-accepting chemotaxis protein